MMQTNVGAGNPGTAQQRLTRPTDQTSEPGHQSINKRAVRIPMVLPKDRTISPETFKRLARHCPSETIYKLPVLLELPKEARWELLKKLKGENYVELLAERAAQHDLLTEHRIFRVLGILKNKFAIREMILECVN